MNNEGAGKVIGKELERGERKNLWVQGEALREVEKASDLACWAPSALVE